MRELLGVSNFLPIAHPVDGSGGSNRNFDVAGEGGCRKTKSELELDSHGTLTLLSECRKNPIPAFIEGGALLR